MLTTSMGVWPTLTPYKELRESTTIIGCNFLRLQQKKLLVLVYPDKLSLVEAESKQNGSLSHIKVRIYQCSNVDIP